MSGSARGMLGSPHGTGTMVLEARWCKARLSEGESAHWASRVAGEGMAAQSRGILILTSSTGGGHDSVAAALQEALHALAPEVSVRILDPLSGKRSDGPLSPGRWYDAMVAHAPWLWGLCYHATDNARAVRLGMAAGALLWARRLRVRHRDRAAGDRRLRPPAVHAPRRRRPAHHTRRPAAALRRHRPGHDSSLLGVRWRGRIPCRDVRCT